MRWRCVSVHGELWQDPIAAGHHLQPGRAVLHADRRAVRPQGETVQEVLLIVQQGATHTHSQLLLHSQCSPVTVCCVVKKWTSAALCSVRRRLLCCQRSEDPWSCSCFLFYFLSFISSNLSAAPLPVSHSFSLPSSRWVRLERPCVWAASWVWTSPLLPGPCGFWEMYSSASTTRSSIVTTTESALQRPNKNILHRSHMFQCKASTSKWGGEKHVLHVFCCFAVKQYLAIDFV